VSTLQDRVANSFKEANASVGFLRTLSPRRKRFLAAHSLYVPGWPAGGTTHPASPPTSKSVARDAPTSARSIAREIRWLLAMAARAASRTKDGVLISSELMVRSAREAEEELVRAIGDGM
jgi:hypothetical protein